MDRGAGEVSPLTDEPRALQVSPPKQALENARFSSHPLHRIAEVATQLRDITTTHVAELDARELGPEALARVQLRSIGRQALQMEALRRTIRQELSNDLTAMDWSAVPDEDHAARSLAQQMR
jgi:hypothetical protein